MRLHVLPFMSESVKLSIQLSHGDGLGVEDIGVDLLKWYPSGSTLALEGRERVAEDLVAFGLSRDGRTDQHKPMTNHRRLIELDALLNKAYSIALENIKL